MDMGSKELGQAYHQHEHAMARINKYYTRPCELPSIDIIMADSKGT